MFKYFKDLNYLAFVTLNDLSYYESKDKREKYNFYIILFIMTNDLHQGT